MKIDLHLHSHVSDGRLSPASLVRSAAAAGLELIALTDHDTSAGVLEAQAEGRELGVRVIPGIEVSSRHEELELHLLGYFVEPTSEAIVQHQATAFEQRQQRMRGMVGKLQDLGIPIAFDDVVEAAGPEAGSLGRPHLARALLAAGHTRFYGEAFLRYLSDAGPAFVLTRFPPVREAIAMIHGAGGVAVWAHPPLELLDEQLPRFVDWGLDGLECYRPGLTPGQSHLLEETARELRLIRTGGSDWHGPYRMALGEFYVGPSDVPEFLELARSREGGPDGLRVNAAARRG